MSKAPSEFHFPSDIKLARNPLLEVWLEIHWQLEAGRMPPFKRDPVFPFALGVFYESIKDSFKHREDLEASHAPDNMLPHIVRHRFWSEEGKWPLLQLGPGVATVNFADHYTWDHFEKMALYLRDKLLNAYGETKLKAQTITLRYRNGASLEQEPGNPLGFLQQNLNTVITLPPRVPGSAGSVGWPTGANIVLNYDLLEPRGIGTLRLMTGTRRQQDPETGRETVDRMLIWQLEMQSKDDDVPGLYKEDEFTRWLTSAHAVIHEWFFSLIDGSLFEMYQGEVE